MTSWQVCSESLHPENPIKAFDTLADSGSPFFAYRLPENDSVTLGIGTLLDVEEYDGKAPGFVAAPFSSERSAKIIKPCVSFQTPWITPTCLPTITVNDKILPSADYVNAINNLTERLKTRGGKTVIARTIDAHSNITSLASVFHALCSRYPGSYVYCWSLDSERFWIGAIPELLLRTSGEKIESMALAGTMEVNSDESWDGKNLEEQQLVTDFISETFIKARMTPEIDGPFDKYAGPVKHLCSRIRSIRPDKDFDVLKFAAQLSPTPAVCGLPREEALADIASIETVDREYYGGYSGPITNRRQCELYVTLRCMAVEKSKGLIRLYVGGGITHLSRPEDEWHETCLKATTLLSIFPDK